MLVDFRRDKIEGVSVDDIAHENEGVTRSGGQGQGRDVDSRRCLEYPLK